MAMALTLAEKAAKAGEAIESGYRSFLGGGAKEIFTGVNTAAFERLKSLGMYKKNEELFTYVGMNRLFNIPFGPETVSPSSVTVGMSEIAPHILGGCAGSVAVFVDGRFARELSNFSALDGVVVAELENAAGEEGSGIAELLLESVASESDRFAVINSLFLSGGVSVDVPSGVELESPIQILHYATGRAKGKVVAPRVFIRLGTGARATVAETSRHDGRGAITTSVTDIVLGGGASIEIFSLQPGGHRFSKYRLAQGGQSTAAAFFCQTGGEPARNNVEVHLAGEGASFYMGGVAVTDGEAEAHSFVKVFHEAPSCKSDQVFKNILKGNSRSSVDTTVVVERSGQLAVSQQLVNSLVLSDGARVGGKPTLTIYADDVKCQHGSTVGSIDDEQLFYLKTRGIAGEEARKLLIGSFAGAVLDRIGLKSFRDAARKALLAGLEG